MPSIQSISETFLKSVERESITPDRKKVSGIVSKNGDSGMLFDNEGNSQFINNANNQHKMNSDSSSATDISFEHNIITNRLNIQTDDITINNQKVNPQLYALSGFVQQTDSCILGNLNMSGTVLVKSWDSYLKKHVYIRRYIRTPILYNTMTSAVVDDRFDIYNSLDTQEM